MKGDIANTEMSKSNLVEKPHKLFISHSSKDAVYVKAFVELLEDIGMTDEAIVCTSVPGYGIPGGEKIYDWLKKQFTECTLRVVFALSHNYYSSPASLNEMGAAWITRTTDTLLLLPGFDFSNIDGCVDSDRIGIKLDGEESELKFRLDELKDTLVSEYSLLPIAGTRWERHRDSFIRSIRDAAEKETENNAESNATEGNKGKRKTSISKEAAILLVYAAEDPCGQIVRLRTLGGSSITTYKWDFVGEDQSPRNVAKWTGALDELLRIRCIGPAGRKGEIFSVTNSGYTVADELKEKMNIDVNNNPDMYLES